MYIYIYMFMFIYGDIGLSYTSLRAQETQATLLRPPVLKKNITTALALTTLSCPSHSQSSA